MQCLRKRNFREAATELIENQSVCEKVMIAFRVICASLMGLRHNRSASSSTGFFASSTSVADACSSIATEGTAPLRELAIRMDPMSLPSVGQGD